MVLGARHGQEVKVDLHLCKMGGLQLETMEHPPTPKIGQKKCFLER